jgi:hypothetical protein
VYLGLEIVVFCIVKRYFYKIPRMDYLGSNGEGRVIERDDLEWIEKKIAYITKQEEGGYKDEIT